MPRVLQRALIIGVLALAAALFGITTFAQSTGETGLVRFVHVVPGAAAIDVYTDGQLTISALDFGQASTFVALPAGERQITVTPSGLTTQLWDQSLIVEGDTAATLIASSTDPLGFQSFRTDLSPLDLGESRITALHAVDGAPEVDVVLADGSPIAPNLAYNTPFGTLDIPAGSYDIGIIPTGGSLDAPLIEPTTLVFNSSTSYIALAYGTPAAPQLMLLSASADAADENAGLVRLVHGVPGAPAVSILLNNTVVAPALAFSNATDYLALPADEYTLAVRLPGSSDDLLTGTLSIAAGDRVTAVAIGTLEAFGIQRFDDDVRMMTADSALVNFINALPTGSVNVALASGETLLNEVVAGEALSSSLPATTDELVVTVSDGDVVTDVPLTLGGGIYGGVFYDVLVVASESGEAVALLLPPVSVAQSIASAPGDTVLVMAEPTALPTEVPLVAVLPTAAEQPAILATATPAPADLLAPASTPLPAAPTPIPTQGPPLPSARVQLDPGANLQLRQYPRSDALSLGLAPSGALLGVLGRPGQPTPPIGATPDPSATPFADPAASLAANQDFDPAQTWLFVEYQTTDGGTINAWVNTLYLAVTTPEGEPQRLADLPTVPANRAGEALNTGVQSPTERQDVVTVTIINLDAGVNLNIRRTIGADGEALARIPVGTTTEFRGISEDGQWVFVRLTATDGGTVDGWISGTYAEFSFNGRPITVEDMLTRNLLNVLPDDTRGGTSSGVAGPGLPTPNTLRDVVVGEVILDPGANLHLRRRANRDSESLSLVPAGTQLIVNGRNEVGDWLNVTFEGIDGWVSSQYLFLTRNGRSVELIELPVVAQATATITPIGFIATPTPEGFVASPTPTLVGGLPAQGLNPTFPVGTDDPNLDPVPGG